MKNNALLILQINSRDIELEYYYIPTDLEFDPSVSVKHLLFTSKSESNHRLCVWHPNSDLDSVFRFNNIKEKLEQSFGIHNPIKGQNGIIHLGQSTCQSSRE